MIRFILVVICFDVEIYRCLTVLPLLVLTYFTLLFHEFLYLLPLFFLCILTFHLCYLHYTFIAGTCVPYSSIPYILHSSFIY